MSTSRPTGPVDEPQETGEYPASGPPPWMGYQPPRSEGWAGVVEWIQDHSFSITLVLVVLSFGGLLYFASRPAASGSTVEQEISLPATAERPGQQKEEKLGTGYATLSVDSEPPDASVVIEGDTVGVTPLEEYRIRSGVYIVTVAKKNYFDRDTVLVLRNDQSTAYTPRLNRSYGLASREQNTEQESSQRAAVRGPDPPLSERQNQRAEPRSGADDIADDRRDQESRPESLSEDGEEAVVQGTLRLRSDPESTAVELDGEAVGVTPLTLEDMPPGTHEVRFDRFGYDPLVRQVEVSAGEATTVEVSLEARLGRLRVLVQPWGSIYVDGELQVRDTDIWYETKLSAGRYTISARHPSLGEKMRTIEIVPGDTQSVVLDMQEE